MHNIVFDSQACALFRRAVWAWRVAQTVLLAPLVHAWGGAQAVSSGNANLGPGKEEET